MNKENIVSTTARFLDAGDILVGSGFVVTRTAYRGVRTPSGKVRVEGHYPGSPVKAYEWNASTRVTVKR